MVVTNVRDISELIALQETLDSQRQLSARYEREMAVIREQLMSTPQMVAEDPATLNLLRIVSRAAMLDTVVLIQGETGAGKERIASYIHQRSPRAKKNFIRVNCGAIPENLAESELFGYVEGSFTGAKKGGHVGYFQQAHRGTIFLDEIAEIDLGTQAKLLRVLQEKEIQPVGSPKTIAVDLRIISATNADLEQLIKAGKFREDLYYRLNVLPIQLPSLAERPEDIEVLALELMHKLNREYGKLAESISSDALFEMMRYDWPGNVRELENIIARAMINMKVGDRIIEEQHLLPLMGSKPQVVAELPLSEGEPIDRKSVV